VHRANLCAKQVQNVPAGTFLDFFGGVAASAQRRGAENRLSVPAGTLFAGAERLMAIHTQSWLAAARLAWEQMLGTHGTCLIFNDLGE
jgi:hypothetical protein